MPRFDAFTLATLLAMPGTAFAYLDPGTGSMILQGLIAGIAVAAVTLKQYWYQVLGFFGRHKEADEGEEERQDG